MLYYVFVAPFFIIIMYLVLFTTFRFMGYRNIPYEMFSDSPLFHREKNIFITNTEHLKEYLTSVHPQMYSVKVDFKGLPPTYDNFYKQYTDSIVDISSEYNEMLESYVEKCNKLLVKYPVYGRYPWEFKMSINNLEKNMPFTIDKYIILPKNTLEDLLESYKHGHFKTDFIDTLIHEKTHVIQRFNQSRFDTFYKTYYKHIVVHKFNDVIPDVLDKNHMANPDSNNSIWLYKLKNHTYIPMLVYSDNKIKSFAFNIEDYRDVIDLDKAKYDFGYRYNISFYHPNEIFACEFTGYVLSNMSSDICDRFINSL